MSPTNANSNYGITREGRVLHIRAAAPTGADRRIEVVLNAIDK
jgi:hypothetical protein